MAPAGAPCGHPGEPGELQTTAGGVEATQVEYLTRLGTAPGEHLDRRVQVGGVGAERLAGRMTRGPPPCLVAGRVPGREPVLPPLGRNLAVPNDVGAEQVGDGIPVGGRRARDDLERVDAAEARVRRRRMLAPATTFGGARGLHVGDRCWPGRAPGNR
ncbi:hypothetical protein GCM10022255_098670 [Dactylosporangium darangshiense]|uniref:Uncharacterized protein n=1 Tax=Dactylosporangium darangshiense TaxID=579108 RepID=A0ABP8DRA9_9ACTN